MNKYFQSLANCLRLAWNRARKKAGITDIRFHDSRQEALSRFCEMGMSVPQAALICGHKDVRQMFRYTHLNPGNMFTNMRPSKTAQKHNDKCHTRWHKLPPKLWRVFARSHALALWLVVSFWLNQEQDNKGLMTQEKKTKRQSKQSRTWRTPYAWMDSHRHFLLSGFWYS